MLKVNFEGRELDVNITQDAYISYQSWSNAPNNWVAIDGEIDGKSCKLLYKWDGESELDTIDYSNPYDIEF
jgi:hypothetical protein